MTTTTNEIPANEIPAIQQAHDALQRAVAGLKRSRRQLDAYRRLFLHHQSIAQAALARFESLIASLPDSQVVNLQSDECPTS